MVSGDADGFPGGPEDLSGLTPLPGITAKSNFDLWRKYSPLARMAATLGRVP